MTAPGWASTMIPPSKRAGSSPEMLSMADYVWTGRAKSQLESVWTTSWSPTDITLSVIAAVRVPPPLLQQPLPPAKPHSHTMASKPWSIANFPRTDTPWSPYPVVPSFGDWAFPHGHVPEAWNLPFEADLSTPGTRCVTTRQSVGLKTAHIVNKEDKYWFRDQDMETRYTAGKGINAVENLMKLRADLHKLYDAYDFVLVPKREASPQGEGENPPTYVLHVLGQGVGEIWAGLHNVPVQGIDHTRSELHFARFGRAILQRVKDFITKGHPRQVIRVDSDGEPKTEQLSGEELRSLYGGGGSMQATPLHPRKRRRAESSHEGEVYDMEDDLSSTQAGEDDE